MADGLAFIRREADAIPQDFHALRDRHLAVTALQALDARDRRALEALLQCRRDGIRLLRRQEAELELLLVVDEIAGLRLRGLCYFHDIHGLLHCIILHSSCMKSAKRSPCLLLRHYGVLLRFCTANF